MPKGCKCCVFLNVAARKFDEGLRFPLCQEGQLESLFQAASLKLVAAGPIDIWMIVQGLKVVAEGKTGHMDRAQRNDKSIFRLGMHWFRYCLKRGFDFEPVFLFHSENELVIVR